jgi:hypothetical protein
MCTGVTQQEQGNTTVTSQAEDTKRRIYFFVVFLLSFRINFSGGVVVKKPGQIHSWTLNSWNLKRLSASPGAFGGQH